MGFTQIYYEDRDVECSNDVPNRENCSVAREMRNYNIDVLGISECRWAGFGQMRVQRGETLLYSGRDNDAHLSSVAMLLSKKAASCLISWSPVND